LRGTQSKGTRKGRAISERSEDRKGSKRIKKMAKERKGKFRLTHKLIPLANENGEPGKKKTDDSYEGKREGTGETGGELRVKATEAAMGEADGSAAYDFQRKGGKGQRLPSFPSRNKKEGGTRGRAAIA